MAIRRGAAIFQITTYQQLCDNNDESRPTQGCRDYSVSREIYYESCPYKGGSSLNPSPTK
jgi:hypothetical protein